MSEGPPDDSVLERARHFYKREADAYVEYQSIKEIVRGIMSVIKVIKKYKIDEQPNDFSFWQSKSYQERLDALEQIRKEYNLWRYNAEQGFQRVYRIVKRI